MLTRIEALASYIEIITSAALDVPEAEALKSQLQNLSEAKKLVSSLQDSIARFPPQTLYEAHLQLQVLNERLPWREVLEAWPDADRLMENLDGWFAASRRAESERSSG